MAEQLPNGQAPYLSQSGGPFPPMTHLIPGIPGIPVIPVGGTPLQTLATQGTSGIIMQHQTPQPQLMATMHISAEASQTLPPPAMQAQDQSTTIAGQPLVVDRQSPMVSDQQQGQQNPEAAGELDDGPASISGMDMDDSVQPSGRDGQQTGDKRTSPGDVEEAESSRVKRTRIDDVSVTPFSGVGPIFFRLENTKTPNLLLAFEGSVERPCLWLENKAGAPEALAPELVQQEGKILDLQLLGVSKLQDGQFTPASTNELAAFYRYSLGKQAPPEGAAPPCQVFIQILCDSAKGWYTYKQEVLGGTWTPSLFYFENGRLEETTPAHFETHKANCVQKKWRCSFKVPGCAKLLKTNAFGQTSIGELVRYIETLVGVSKPPPSAASNAGGSQTGGAQVVEGPRRVVPPSTRASAMPVATRLRNEGLELLRQVPGVSQGGGGSPGPQPSVPGLPIVSPSPLRDPRLAAAPAVCAPHGSAYISTNGAAPGMGGKAPGSGVAAQQRPGQAPPGPSFLAIPINAPPPADASAGMAQRAQAAAPDMADRPGGTVRTGSVSGILCPAEVEAIQVIVNSVPGPELSHAVQGIMYHVARFYHPVFKQDEDGPDA